MVTVFDTKIEPCGLPHNTKGSSLRVEEALSALQAAVPHDVW